MIKQTLYFGNPAYLRVQREQLCIEVPATGKKIQKPIEDIGIIILDHPQITLTQTVLARMLENNVALITCDAKHHPIGLMLNLAGHTLQSQKFRSQIEATLPLKKQLWQQTIEAKVRNQASVLDEFELNSSYLFELAKKVRSGDPDNVEATAANYYWKQLFAENQFFVRNRFGPPPNHMLNYGYAILRAVVARNLVGSGLLPTLGIFHRNQYNAYCLADDIMEPYRPYVDRFVLSQDQVYLEEDELTPEIKKLLLQIPAIDVLIQDKISPLMVAVQRTTASLVKCFEGKEKKLVYPQLEPACSTA